MAPEVIISVNFFSPQYAILCCLCKQTLTSDSWINKLSYKSIVQIKIQNVHAWDFGCLNILSKTIQNCLVFWGI